MHAFREVETAAYCPRKLYYRRQSPADEETPPEIEAKRELAFQYERLLEDDELLESAPIEPTPTQYRSRLGSAKARLDDWAALVDPAERDVFLDGRECRGIAHKRLETDPPTATVLFGGSPPETGVWRPQSVRLMAVAKALSWEEQATVESVYAEYPAYGVIRNIDVGARRTAAYREAVRIADAIDDPPARTDNRSKCEPCEYRSKCGVRTRSLRTLLKG